ncbi:MAG: P-II family nitrogen regulator, partial [Clostridia bacterium]|nr:P-II family nitrogen regulator [Clostridia bacterium]
KAVCLAVASDPTWRTVKRSLQRKLRIDVPGTGIAFTIPMSSVGGPRELAFLTDGQSFERGEETTLKQTEQQLLIVIGRQGYNDLIMEAARAAGAAGGTVIHAQGTGMQKAEQFLGITLASEKEMIFIVTKTEQKNAIMQSIMQKAGLNTKAQAIVFSVPVTDTAGLRLLEDDESKAETASTDK